VTGIKIEDGGKCGNKGVDSKNGVVKDSYVDNLI